MRVPASNTFGIVEDVRYAVYAGDFMIADQLQSHLSSDQELLKQGRIAPALREAEFTVDEFGMAGDVRIASALPLLSLLRHAIGVDDSPFADLCDLPKSLSSNLAFEATLLHGRSPSDASAKMLDDWDGFMSVWIGNDHGLLGPLSQPEACSEKASELIVQIEQLKADGKKKLAVEVALELANEYAFRNENRKACKLFKQVLGKAKRYELTNVRIDGLLGFGQFFTRLGMVKDAERALRLAAGVARRTSDADRYSHVIAALGVVLAHAKKESAKKYLTKASVLLSPWDVEADIVNHHLESIREGKLCDCPEASSSSSLSGTDWN